MTDYALSISLDHLAARIRAEHEEVRLSARATIEHAFRVGELLLEAKQAVRHGFWGDWLLTHCDLSERSAQNYMRLARNRANPQLTADLTMVDALKALMAPAPEIGEADAIADVVISDAAAWLPADGQARVGTLDVAYRSELFGVIEDERHPGFYRLAHIEMYPDDIDDGLSRASGGCFTEPERGRSVRGDFVRLFLEHFTRHPEAFGRIEWMDVPPGNWPFPSRARWP
jgi:hypothetical protein